jgi:hypothetical protein
MAKVRVSDPNDPTTGTFIGLGSTTANRNPRSAALRTVRRLEYGEDRPACVAAPPSAPTAYAGMP